MSQCHVLHATGIRAHASHGCNARAAARLYRERYPNENRYPDYRVFFRVHSAFLEGRPRRIDEEAVLKLIEEDPSTSIRSIWRRTGVSIATVHRILKRYELLPYHSQRVQSLLPRDFPARVQFCRTMLRKIREDPKFFNHILWSDESSCKREVT